MLRVLGTLRQKTDYRRWAQPRNIYASWESRTQQAAARVPDGSRVIEFGAGKRALERYLDPSCSYVPSDLVDRGPGTVVIDLNRRPLPDLGADTYDVAVIMGVLEYLRDVPAVLDWLSKQVPFCVVSYACTHPKSFALRALTRRAGRLNHGWMNNYSQDELCSLFRERGYVPLHEEGWEDQRLFVFSQQPPA